MAAAPVYHPAPVPSYEVFNDNQVVELDRSQVCPDGWRRYGDSCYYVEMEKLDYNRAEQRCSAKGATMLAADTLEEWDEVMTFTPQYFWTWTGITQDRDGEGPHFKGGALDASRVNWLVKSSSSASNGWTSASRCAAYYNMDLVASNYVYFYPCSNLYYSICKKSLGNPLL
ncbi:lectin C-type domain protein [Ancylostoma ceylanicum]|nr:lectin C-type domain protein [Ancylostoma ceylanicum]